MPVKTNGTVWLDIKATLCAVARRLEPCLQRLKVQPLADDGSAQEGAAIVWQDFPSIGVKPVYGGHGTAADKLNRRRVRARRAMHVEWCKPTAEEADRYGDAPLLKNVADFFEGIAEVGDETWLILGRLFSGWPDPPAYAVLFLDTGGRVLAAVDCAALPWRWRMTGR